MRASEERFSKAFAASPLAMSISRFADRRFIEVNESFERVTGYRRAEVLGRQGLEIGLWPSVEARDQVPRIADRQGSLRDIECRLRLRSGQVHTFSLSAETIEIGGEQCVLSVIDDITERKQREEALREAMATSERHRAQFEAVFQTVADGIVVSDMSGNLIHVNEAEARIRGFGSPEEMHRNLAYFAEVYELNTLDGRLLPLEEWPLSKALRGESFTEWELRGRRKDTGQEWFFSFSGEPVRDEHDELVMVVIVTRDITGRKQAEAEIHLLNEALEQRVTERTAQLEAANKELESFSYSVSHDLRAPLRAIDGFSRILLEDYADKFDAEGRRVLNVVRSNTVKMSHLIDDLLEFSRLGRRAMEDARIALGELAQTAFDELRLANPERVLELQKGSLPPARGDRAMLRQVMINLLSNAVKFTRARDVGRIEIGSQVENGETVYYVRDNGAGFDMQYADKLFGVFQRLHSDKEYEGTGVGLSIVQRILHRHGGRIWAEGEVGKGATFYFTLPGRVAVSQAVKLSENK
jgi:PAS domain S-box-containing protein